MPHDRVRIAPGLSDADMTGGDLQQAAGVREGQTLAGKYRVERVLGVGGMGVVVAARHIQLDTRVALKFLLPSMLVNQEAVSRFAREARAAVKITSEHVARVLDVGTLENGAPYLVMEFLEGGDLAGWLQQRGALSVEQAVEFVLHACVALADAHGIGIVHRDLKPANLFCVRRSDGQLIVKVLDFGISKMTDANAPDSGMSMTRTSAVLGSPLYMSPEQMQTPKDVDSTTDIWALGVILYELLTARVPFDGQNVAEVAVKAATQRPIPMRTIRPDVPAGLEAIVDRCLEKDRRNRYRHVGELAVALLEFGPKRARASVERISGIVRGAGLSADALAVPPSVSFVETQLEPGTVAPAAVTQEAGVRKKTLVATAFGATAVLCTVAIAAFFGRSDHTAAPAQIRTAEPAQSALVAPIESTQPHVTLAPAEVSRSAPPPITAPIPQREAHNPRPRVVPTAASTLALSAAPPPPPPPAQPAAQAPAATPPSSDPLSKLRVK